MQFGGGRRQHVLDVSDNWSSCVFDLWAQVEDAMLMYDKQTQRHRGMIQQSAVFCSVTIRPKLSSYLHTCIYCDQRWGYTRNRLRLLIQRAKCFFPGVICMKAELNHGTTIQIAPGKKIRYPHVGECTLPLRVPAVACTMRNEVLRSVAWCYGTLRKRCGSLQNVTEPLRNVTEPLRKISIMPITNW